MDRPSFVAAVVAALVTSIPHRIGPSRHRAPIMPAFPLRPLALLLAAASLAGCVTTRPSSLDLLNAQPPQEYRGFYTVGEQGGWFRACGTPESEAPRWVTVTDAAIPRVDEARREGRLVDGRPSYVHWRAVLTRGGEVGPPGSTALLVREVLAIRPAAGAADCPQS